MKHAAPEHSGQDDKARRRSLLEEAERILADTGTAGEAALRMFLGNATHLAIEQTSAANARELTQRRAEQLARDLDSETLQQMRNLAEMIADSRSILKVVAGEKGRLPDNQDDSPQGLSESEEAPQPGEIVFEQKFKGERRDYAEIAFHKGARWTDNDLEKVTAFVERILNTSMSDVDFELSFGNVRLRNVSDTIDVRKRFVTGRLLDPSITIEESSLLNQRTVDGWVLA